MSCDVVETRARYPFQWVNTNLFIRATAVLAAVSLTIGAARAERPSAPQMLPESTLAILRVPDTKEFVQKFGEGSMGRMLQDEQIKPLASQVYGSVAELFGQVQEQVGLPLDKILAIPQGELCLALVATKSGPPAVVVLLEAADEMPSVTRLLERASEEMTKQGVEKTTEALGDTLLTRFARPNRPGFTYCIKDGVFLASSNDELLKSSLGAWNGTPDTDWVSLADNKKYTAIMSRCGSGEDRPHVTFFIDPIELFRSVARGNFSAQAALAILPALGLDGVQGLGASLYMGSGEYDAVQHMHVLLDNPRGGALQLLALKSGESTPEPWVPSDVATYMTLHWDFQVTYRELVTLVDSFQTEGTVARFMKERFEDPLGVEFEKEMLDQMEGRVTYLSWFEKPTRLGGQKQIVALKLKDPDTFRKTLDRVVAKYEDRFEKDAFGGVSFHRIKVPDDARRRRPVDVQAEGNNTRVQLNVNPPDPCFLILGDYFCIADGSSIVRQCIVSQSDPDKTLATALDYKLIASKISRQTGGNKPGMILFNRPEEGMRALYDMAQDPDNRKFLAQQAETNPFLKSLNKAFDDNPLPPFSVISKYFAPAGGMVVNDETGFHYMTFGLKRN